MLGQAQEALPYFIESARRTPDQPSAQRMLAICYVETGQMDEARYQVRELMRAMPEFRVDEYATFTNDPALRERMRTALRQADAH